MVQIELVMEIVSLVKKRLVKVKSEKIERMINLKNKPSWHLTDSEKKELITMD